MFGLTHLLGLLLAPVLLWPAQAAAPDTRFQAQWDASSTVPGYVSIYSDINGVSTTTVIRAPYGMRSSFESVSDGTSTRSYATTTPMTAQDIASMEAQQKAFEADMERQMQDEEKMFQDMWNGSDL